MASALITPNELNLKKFGAEPMARWLIQAARERGKITYSEVKYRLEKHHGFSSIYSRKLGHPAGKVMEELQNIAPKVPLLNVLVVYTTDGLPGPGPRTLMASRFKSIELQNPNAREVHEEEWRRCFERAAEEVYSYPHWEKHFHKIFGHAYVPALNRELDGVEQDGQRRGRGGEGPNHKNLRLWVQKNPGQLFPRLKNVRAETEEDLLSGDRVDVVYYATRKTVAIEVKSRDSNYEDYQRGVYQCVKYRAVMEAVDARADAPVEAVLVTETPLPTDLGALVRQLKIKHIQVPQDRT